MAEAPKFNLRNPAVKRIMQEIKEIKQDTSGDFLAEALETDIFEWHFVIRGPQDTEFDGGIYHGRILLPAEYPFKPPSFMMLTPNGRFETNVKICLSISSHHPEHWQPSWSVRTALMALIAFMPSPGAGALGALDFTKEERRVLAARSRSEVPRFGSAERQRVIDDMHSRIGAIAAAKEAERAAAREAQAGASKSPDSRPSLESKGLAAERPEPQGSGELPPPSPRTSGQAPQGTAAEPGTTASAGPQPASRAAAAERATSSGTSPAPGASVGPTPGPSSATTPSASSASLARLASASAHAARPSRGSSSGSIATTFAAAAAAASSPQQASAPVAVTQGTKPPPSPSRPPAAVGAAAVARTGLAAAPAPTAVVGGPAPVNATSTDHMLTALMWALYVGIGAILLRKVMGVMGMDLAELLQ